MEDLMEEQFDELFFLYPQRDSGSGRVFRAATRESREYEILKQKYLRKLDKKPNLHAKVLKCLRKELEIRDRKNSIQYMKKLETYLNQEAWNDYDIGEDINIDRVEGF